MYGQFGQSANVDSAWPHPQLIPDRITRPYGSKLAQTRRWVIGCPYVLKPENEDKRMNDTQNRQQ